MAHALGRFATSIHASPSQSVRCHDSSNPVHRKQSERDCSSCYILPSVLSISTLGPSRSLLCSLCALRCVAISCDPKSYITSICSVRPSGQQVNMQIPPPSIFNSWPAPNIVNPETRGPCAIITVSVLLGVVTLLLVVRIYTRVHISQGFGLDDVFILLAYVRSCSHLFLPPCHRVVLELRLT